MSDTCPVVKIKSDNPAHKSGFVEINESDFDPSKGHELFEGETLNGEDTVQKAVRLMTAAVDFAATLTPAQQDAVQEQLEPLMRAHYERQRAERREAEEAADRAAEGGADAPAAGWPATAAAPAPEPAPEPGAGPIEAAAAHPAPPPPAPEAGGPPGPQPTKVEPAATGGKATK